MFQSLASRYSHHNLAFDGLAVKVDWARILALLVRIELDLNVFPRFLSFEIDLNVG